MSKHLWDTAEINRPLFEMGKLTRVSISKLSVPVVVPGFKDKNFHLDRIKMFSSTTPPNTILESRTCLVAFDAAENEALNRIKNV